jgi:hypothetical protein
MLASGPIALSALFLIQANTAVDAGARLETRAGEMPLLYGNESQGLFITSFTPSLGLSIQTKQTRFQTNYAPRLLWSVPNAKDGVTPFLLQTFTLTNAYLPTRRSEWHMSLAVRYGEEDTVALAQLLPGQASLPSSMRMLSVEAATGGSWRATRRASLSLQLTALHRRPLDTQDTPTILTLGTQTTLTTAPSFLYALTRHSRLDVSIPVSYLDFSDGRSSNDKGIAFQTLIFQPQVSWTSDFSRRNSLRLGGGVSYADMITSLNNNQAFKAVTPMIRMALGSILVSHRSLVLRSDLSAEVNWYLDPVLGTIVPRAPLGARLNAAMGPHWSAGAFVNFTTNVTWEPMNPTQPNATRNGGYPDETLFSAGIPVRYLWSNQLIIELSGRVALRGPHLRVPSKDFGWGQTEYWGTLTVSVADRFRLGSS